jgi:Rrf2 family protein
MKNIFSISDAASLALHTMVILAAQPDSTFSNREIASLLHASEHHLSKVLQRLTREGLVSSARGPKGGFKVSPEWKKITLLQVYEAIEGPMETRECLLSRPACGNDNECILGDLLKVMNSKIRKTFSSTNLSNIVRNRNFL